MNKILQNKKLIAIIAVLLVALIGGAIWMAIYRPFDDSLKNITVEIVDANSTVVLSKNYRTNASTLEEFINVTEKETFKPVIVGSFLNEIFGIVPNSAKREFISPLSSDTAYADDSAYAITKKAKNGVSCTTTKVGIPDIALKDGKTYMFVIATW